MELRQFVRIFFAATGLVFGLSPPAVAKPAPALRTRIGPQNEALAGQPATLEFAARPPAGAADHGYFLPAHRVTLEQSFDRSLVGLETGSALRRTITLIAEGAPAQLLPPLDPAPVDGTSVSTLSPVSSDLSGPTFGSQKSQSATYVFQRAGNFILPAVRIHWWDVSAQRMQEAVLPEQPVAVAPNTVEKHETWRQELMVGALLLFVLVALGEFVYFGRGRRSKRRVPSHRAGKD